MITSTKRASLSVSASVLAILGATSVAAQPAVGIASDDQSPNAEGVSEIIVTAQKRSERLQDVPVSVAALTPDVLAKTAIDSTSALNSLVPGLNLNHSAFGFKPYLRGVGTGTSASGNENSVSTYIDNIYLASMNAALFNLTSIESIEVLKGPQGTLFGRNATGGVIHIRTRDPSQDFGGNASVSLDNYKALVATGYVTGGLGDNLAADLAVHFRHQYEGYGINLLTGNDVNYDHNLTLRSKIKFTPSDADTLILAVDYTRQRSSGNTYNAYPGTTTNFGRPTPTQPLPAGAPYAYTGSPWDTETPLDPFYRMEAGGVSLTYTHDFSWASLSSFTAYRKSRIHLQWNGTPVPTNAQIVDTRIPEEQFSQEIQLQSLASSPVKWILGAYYIDAKVSYAPFINRLLSQAPNEQRFIMTQTIKSPALYGQITVPVQALGDTNITGGLRYTIDKRAIVGRIDIGPAASPGTVLQSLNPTDASKTFRTFTWRLGIDHHITPDVMIYATYNRGFKAGAFNSIPPGGPTTKATNPEFLDAYEIGMKNTLFGGDATLNIAAFLYDYRDLQVTIFNQTAATIENAAAAQIKGIDVDFTWQATNNLRLVLSGEFLDHKFKKYPNGPILRSLTLAEGGGVTRTFGNLAGKPLPYTASTVVNAAAFYNVPTSFGEFDMNVNFSWNSGFTVEPSAVVKVPSYVDLNASIGFTLPNGTTRLSAFGRNLTNAAVPRAIATATNPGGYIESQYRPPRTYGVSLSQKF